MWQAYDAQEHRREVAEDYQSAKICSVMVNMQRASNSEAVELKDFLIYPPQEQESKREQTPDEIATYIQAINAGCGGTVVTHVNDSADESEVTKSLP